jgi:poly(A) polymerase
MNAIAVEIEDALILLEKTADRKRSSPTGLTPVDLRKLFIDPFGGLKDIKDKKIRIVNKMAFREDPLRVMRAFSFAALLGFNIDKQTLRLLKLEIGKLSGVSWERIRDELFKILECESAFGYLLEMDKLKILKIIFPEIEKMHGVDQGPYHHLGVWQHTLEAIRQVELLIKELKKNRQVQDYLNEIISPGRDRRALLKLGAFLHDIGKPAALRYEDGKTKFYGHEKIGLALTEEICRRLRLSNNETDSLKTMVLGHLRPGYLADIEELTPRAKFRYFRDTGREAVSVLLLSVADQRATKGPLTRGASRSHHEKIVFGLIREYFKKREEKRLPRLLNGDELMQKFKLGPSPLIGKILSEVEELQAIGKLKTKQEAFKIAETRIHTDINTDSR